MTLQELLDLKIIRGNIHLQVFKRDFYGLGEFIKEYNIIKTGYCLITKEILLKNNVSEDLFTYCVSQLSGDDYKNKLFIVIEKKEA